MVNDKLLDGGGQSSYKNIICCGSYFFIIEYFQTPVTQWELT